MRRALLAVLVGCAGAPEPTCDPQTCADWCSLHVSPYELDWTEQRTSPRLTDVERRLLMDRLFAYRHGAVLTSPEALRFCVGGPECAKTVVQPIQRPLEPGAHQLQMELRVPADGTWTLDYRRTCTGEDNPTCSVPEDVQSQRPLRPGPEGLMTLPTLDRFEVFEGDCPTSCDATMTILGGNEPIVYTLHWDAPAMR